jgi:tetratricopeptide (TPR) repeat protein
LQHYPLKALEKDRARRYASASELAADIGRYLRNEPVIAHAPSTAYRVQKYIRRHRLGVALVATVVLLLIGVAIAQFIELRRIREERDRADRVTQFMTGMFQAPDPSEDRGNTVSAREILDKASKEIDTNLQTDPELQAKMMFAMARTYIGLGLYPRAQHLLEGALEIQRRVLGPRNPETLTTMHYLAVSRMQMGRFSDAEKLIRETIDARQSVLGAENRDTLDSESLLVDIFAHEAPRSELEQSARNLIDVQRRVLGPEDPNTLHSMTVLAIALCYQNRYVEGEELIRKTLEIQRRVLGFDRYDTLRSMSVLAFSLDGEKRYTEAEQLRHEELDIMRWIRGTENITHTAGNTSDCRSKIAALEGSWR